MKGNKKLLVVALLLLLITVTFSTYAIYRESTNTTGNIKAAAWSVKIKKATASGEGTAFASANLTFTADDVTWTNNPGKNGTIAPGATGTISFEVDATGSEVDVVVDATMGTATLPNGFTAAVTSGANTTIAYNATSMKATVTVTVTWEGALTDDDAKDGTDLAVKGTQLTIPVTVTARQAL